MKFMGHLCVSKSRSVIPPSRGIGRRTRLQRIVVCGLVTGGLSLLLVPAVVSASTAQKIKVCRSATGQKLTGASVCKGLAFYSGHTITFIAPSAVAGSYDEFARALQPYLASYLHATVNVIDISTGGDISGQDQTASAADTGLTIGALTSLSDASDAAADVPGLNFNPSRVAWIAGTGPGTDVLVQRPNGPFTTFAALKAATTPTRMITVTSSGTSTIYRMFMAAFGVPSSFITGYANVAALESGYVRGDANVTMSSLTALGSLVASKQAQVLAITNVPAVGTNFRAAIDSAPTFSQLERKFPAKTKSQKNQYAALNAALTLTGQAVFTQTRVSSDKVDALRAATQWAFQQPGFKTAMLAAAQNPKYVSPATAKASYASALKLSSYMAAAING